MENYAKKPNAMLLHIIDNTITVMHADSSFNISHRILTSIRNCKCKGSFTVNIIDNSVKIHHAVQTRRIGRMTIEHVPTSVRDIGDK